MRLPLRRRPTPPVPLAFVYVVNVLGRVDGVYVFDDKQLAEDFAYEVAANGGDPVVSEEPVNSGLGAVLLIDAERED